MKPKPPVYGPRIERFTDTGKILSLSHVELRFCWGENPKDFEIDLPDEKGAVAVHRSIIIPLDDIFEAMYPTEDD